MAFFYRLDETIYGCPYMTFQRNKKMKSHKHMYHMQQKQFVVWWKIGLMFYEYSIRHKNKEKEFPPFLPT